MKQIERRIGQLERKINSPQAIASNLAVTLVLERRMRRLRAAGVPEEQLLRPVNRPEDHGRPLSEIILERRYARQALAQGAEQP